MTQWNHSVKQDVARQMNELADKYHLAPAKVGEDEVLATAVVDGLSMPNTLEPVVLCAIGRKEGLSVEARNVCYAGSNGATVNRAVSYIMGRIFLHDNDEDSPDQDQIQLCGVLADLFRRDNRTTEDLIAMIVAASNGITLRTSAAVDFRDGEVVVDTFVECEPNELPADFELAVGRVLQHAALLQRTARIVRDLMSPEHRPAPRTIDMLFQKLRVQKSPEAEEAEREAPVEVTL